MSTTSTIKTTSATPTKATVTNTTKKTMDVNTGVNRMTGLFAGLAAISSGLFFAFNKRKD